MRVLMVRRLSGLFNSMPYPELGEVDLPDHAAEALIRDGLAEPIEAAKPVDLEKPGKAETASVATPETAAVKRGPGRPKTAKD